MLDAITTLSERLGGAALAPLPGDGQRRAAVAVVLHVSLPGGRHEPEDPHLLATAIREAREELDIELQSAQLLGSLPTLHPLMAGPRGIEVTPYVFSISKLPELRMSVEAQSVFWLPLQDVVAGRLDGTFVHAESSRSFPAWIYQGYTVWGMTMRILVDLIDRIRVREAG
jgi:8-oxo-dGTP pyrophosphatase MutT (NUDIX family)